MNETKKRLLIVGAGFGGAKVALELGKDSRFDVTLLAGRQDFYYYPTLYHTATGGNATQSRIPLERLFRNTPAVKLVSGMAKSIDRAAKMVQTDNGETYPYDIVVFSLGTVPSYFGIRGIAEHSYSIYSPDKARQLKQHIHDQLTDGQQVDLKYIVVGAGPTGIELSSSLPGYAREVAKAHGLKPRNLQVDLLEAAPKMLSHMPESMSAAVAKRLENVSVHLSLSQAVQSQTADELIVNGNAVKSDAVIWTAGNANNPFFKDNNFELTPRGRVIVNEFMQAEPDVYVIGDNAETKFAGMAQTALYDGTFVARNLKRQISGSQPQAYKPKVPIYVIPAGKGWAAVLWGKREIYGWLGWTLRMLADLVAFKDYEPWWQAGKQWLTEFKPDDICETCSSKQK